MSKFYNHSSKINNSCFMLVFLLGIVLLKHAQSLKIHSPQQYHLQKYVGLSRHQHLQVTEDNHNMSAAERGLMKETIAFFDDHPYLVQQAQSGRPFSQNSVKLIKQFFRKSEYFAQVQIDHLCKEMINGECLRQMNIAKRYRLIEILISLIDFNIPAQDQAGYYTKKELQQLKAKMKGDETFSDVIRCMAI